MPETKSVCVIELEDLGIQIDRDTVTQRDFTKHDFHSLSSKWSTAKEVLFSDNILHHLPRLSSTTQIEQALKFEWSLASMRLGDIFRRTKIPGNNDILGDTLKWNGERLSRLDFLYHLFILHLENQIINLAGRDGIPPSAWISQAHPLSYTPFINSRVDKN